MEIFFLHSHLIWNLKILRLKKFQRFSMFRKKKAVNVVGLKFIEIYNFYKNLSDRIL
jgi:hypothetical protein